MKIDIRKSRGMRIALWAFFWSSLFLGVAAAQIPVTDDAFTSSATPNANYGVSLGLVVQSATANGTMMSPIEFGGSTANTYLKFDLSAVPSNVSASNLAKVNLRLFVDFVVSPGKFDVYLANGPWTEGTLTANNAPGHTGTAIASGVSVTSVLKYIDIDVTSAWANGPPTNGLVLVPSPGSNIFVSFDSKESPLTSHDPELSISVNDASSIQLQQEITRAEQAENTISTNLSNEVVRAENAEGVVNNAILNEAEARIAGDSALQQTINSLFIGNVAVGGTLSGATVSSGNGGFQFGNTEVLSILPGLFNLWVGQDAGRGAGANNTGSNNTASGFHALFSNTTGSFNVANGSVALYSNTTGGSNIAVGVSALTANTTGNDNTAVGNSALSSNTIGAVNTATGNNALVSNTTGGANTGVGDGALYGNTTGSANTSIGRLSLAGLGTDASNNTGLGAYAGNSTNSQPTTGSSNTYIGYQSNSGDQLNLSNATAIGANAQVTASNALVLGSINGVNGATASTNVGIGTTAPQFTLDVNGTANFAGPVAFAPNQTFTGDGSGLMNVMALSALTSNTATTATNALQLNGQPASAYAQLPQSNTFNGTQTINGSLILGSGGGITFPDGTTQTTSSTQAAAVPSGSVILGNSSTPPAGYTTTGILGGTGQWYSGPGLPFAAASPGVGVLNGQIYVVGNLPCTDLSDPFCDRTPFYSWDTLGGTWTALADYPKALAGVEAGGANGKIFTFGGLDPSFGTVVNDKSQYDPVTNQWGPLSSAGMAEYGASTVITQGGIIGLSTYTNPLIWFIGGFDGNHPVGTEFVDTTNGAVVTPLDFNVGRSFVAAAQLNGLIYVLGGVSTGAPFGNCSLVSKSAQVFDTTGGGNSGAIADLPVATYGAVAAALNGKIYLFGGFQCLDADPGTHDVVTNLGYVYDPASNTWSSGPAMPTARGRLGIAVVNGRAFAIGGVDAGGNFLGTVEQYSPPVYMFTKN